MIQQRLVDLVKTQLDSNRAFHGSYGRKFDPVGVRPNLFGGVLAYGAVKAARPVLSAQFRAAQREAAYGWSYGDDTDPLGADFVEQAQELPSVGFPLGEFYEPYDRATQATQRLARNLRIQFVDSDYSRDLAGQSGQRYTGSGIDEGPKSNMTALKDYFNIQVKAFKSDREVFERVQQFAHNLRGSEEVSARATLESIEAFENAFDAVLQLGPQSVAMFKKACIDFATYWGY